MDQGTLLDSGDSVGEGEGKAKEDSRSDRGAGAELDRRGSRVLEWSCKKEAGVH